jgi:hypothetical protein
MYYLANVHHKSMAKHKTRSDCKGFKKCCISSAVDGTDDDMLRNGSEEDGNVMSECEEGEGSDREDGE